MSFAAFYMHVCDAYLITMPSKTLKNAGSSYIGIDQTQMRRQPSWLQGKKIQDEEKALNKKKKFDKTKSKATPATATSTTSSSSAEPTPIKSATVVEATIGGTSAVEVPPSKEPVPASSQPVPLPVLSDDSDFEMVDGDRVLVNSNFKPFRVPRKDPTAQSQVSQADNDNGFQSVHTINFLHLSSHIRCPLRLYSLASLVDRRQLR